MSLPWAEHLTLNAPSGAGRALHGSSHLLVYKCVSEEVNKRPLLGVLGSHEGAGKRYIIAVQVNETL